MLNSTLSEICHYAMILTLCGKIQVRENSFSDRFYTVLTIENRIRSSRSQMFFKIGVFKKFRNNHRKIPALESLINKVAGLCLQHY